MSEKSEPREVEVVEALPEIDEKLVKAFEKIAEKTYLMIAKRDYRSTLVHRQEKAWLGALSDEELREYIELLHRVQDAVDPSSAAGAASRPELA